MDVDSFLKDWTITLIKYKDSVKKSIQNIKDIEKNDFIVDYQEGEVYFLVRGNIDSAEQLIRLLDERQKVNLIMLNSKSNLKFLIDNWKSLAAYEFLNIYFVNPFSSIDTYWIIRPHIHQKICDDEGLEAGLKAMFESVEEIDESLLKKHMKTKEL